MCAMPGLCRDILRPTVIHNAYGFILAHNHPRIKQMIDEGKPMPEYFKKHPVYYAGFHS